MDDEVDMRKYIEAVASLDFSPKASHKDKLCALLLGRFTDLSNAELEDDELEWASGGLSIENGEKENGNQ